MFCENCGAELKPGQRFCTNCGTRVPDFADHTAAREPEKAAEAAVDSVDKAETAVPAANDAANPAAEEAAPGASSEPSAATDGAPASHTAEQGAVPPTVLPPAAAASAAPGEKNDKLAFIGLIDGIVGAVLAVLQAFNLLGTFFSAITGLGHIVYSPLYAVYPWFSLIPKFILLAGLAAGAVTGFLLFRCRKPGKYRSFLSGAIISGALILIGLLIDMLVRGLLGVHSSTPWALLVYPVCCIGVLVFFLSGAGQEPLADYQKGNAANVFRDDFQELKNMTEDSTREFSSGNTANTGSTDTGSTGNSNGAPALMPTDRNLVMAVILSIFTCGLYGLWLIHTMSKDANILCEGDGRETPGVLKTFLLSLVTCGFYNYYWYYCLGNRLADNAPKHDLVFQENGTTVLLWDLFGVMICGIGPFVALHILFKNLNALSAAYNREHELS